MMLRKKTKQLISSTLILVLLLSLFPTALAAEGNTREDNFDHLLGNENVKRPSEAGALQLKEVDGQMTLVDQHGEKIQLRGMSTHGLQWFPEILNDNAYKALSNDWDSNMIRLAMYVGENGYATNPELIKQRVIDGIELAIENDMYVIVDWHVHAPGDPRDPVYAGAEDFFRDIAALYPNNPHIIYELANEPSSNNNGGAGIPNNEEGWKAVKEYADPIVEMLRDSGNADDNIIIVGSPNWSQRPDLAADNPINDHHTMYTVHFYTGSHAASTESYPPETPNSERGNVMSNTRYALENGVAVFATEWGTSQANGDGGPYFDEADVWIEFLNENNISWANWSLTNKNEVSGAFTPFELGKSNATSLDPGPDQVWAPEELSLSGEYVRARIKGAKYEPIDRTRYTKVLWDFNDGTKQGFGVNSDSPNKEAIEVENENGTLRISGLNVSNDLSDGNFWANVRLSANGWGKSVDILGAEKLTMDVIVDEPTTVAIAAIPQSTKHGWANPERSVKVTEADFVKQDDGKYKALLTITGDDAPNLKNIGKDDENNNMNNIILFVGTEAADVIYLDNIKVTGKIVEIPVVHSPKGDAALPSNFEYGTRQGWDWAGESGVKTALTIEEANGSQALSWEFGYPEVKPSDNWASAPRLDFHKDNLVRGENDYVAFDFYIDPARATEGAMNINLVFQPPANGYWVQAPKTFTINFEELEEANQVNGLYHYEVKINVRDIANIQDDTVLRNMILIFADVQSDFAGRVFVDNVRFEASLQSRLSQLSQLTQHRLSLSR
nr:endo-1,4-beta-glucanase [Bacillus sp.] [Bacillus sp. (in: firmicutes)]